MIAATWLVLVAGQGPLALSDLQASVNRTRVTVGEQVTLTVRARSRSAEPLSISLPALAGFAIVGSREVSEVAIEGSRGPTRTTTRELRLRVERSGTLVIGPVRASQGARALETAPIAIRVDSAAAAPAPLVGARARELISAASPPADVERVTVEVLRPADTVLAGAQLDVVAAAWFPRELRTRLRHAPLLAMQTPEGVWAYPGAAPAEVAASRQVRGRWMDLFVAHQIVFALTPGQVVIPPATLAYAVPVTFSFFSREERYSLKSDSVAVTVLPLPEAGRPNDDQRVVADGGLTLALAIDPVEGRVGEPMRVVARVSGVGNVALWPEPAIRWPPGVRAYPAETEMRLEPRDGRIAGSKTFRYLVVPDSAGSLQLPEVRYPFYDLTAGAYGIARAAPTLFAVAPGAEPQAARPLPPLDLDARRLWTDELAGALVPWGGLALVVGPPLLAWLSWRRRAPRAGSDTGPREPQRLTRLGRLEWEFHALLASHVPDRAARDGDRLARALRAAGVESAVADHVMRLRDRLRAARYGRRGVGDAAELGAEIEQVLRVLGAEPAGRAGTRRRVVTALCLAGLLGPPLRLVRLLPPPQAPSAEALYSAGALAAAADSFAARAAAEPRVAAHWYNLGATLYRAGADGKATAAWARAARLAPRAPLIRRARELLPPPDVGSESLLAVGPATPAEWALAAGVGWLACWATVLMRRRRPVLVALALATALATGLSALEWQRHTRAIFVVVTPGTPVRAAPYGGASAAASVEAGGALRVVRRYGGWLEVRRRDGVRGWVLATDTVPL